MERRRDEESGEPEADPLARRFVSTLLSVIQVGAAIDMRPRAFGTDKPLSRTEIHTVSEIAMKPGIGTTELAARQGVTKGAVSQILQRLEERGLIRRHADGRTVRLEVTAKGRRAHARHLEFHAAQEQALRSVYGHPADMLTDLEALQRVLRALESFAAGDTH
jgi:DNA-binding MarR family transcriptional regulator